MNYTVSLLPEFYFNDFAAILRSFAISLFFFKNFKQFDYSPSDYQFSFKQTQFMPWIVLLEVLPISLDHFMTW